MAAATTDGPLSQFRALVRAGDLQPDSAQELAVERLETLHRRLIHYEPAIAAGWRRSLRAFRRTEPPEGLYLFGGVGRGKSMLMDLFFRTSHVGKRRRVHFHAFMQEVHAKVHAWRQEEVQRPGASDPVPVIARRLAADAWLLCFDELQVNDIADAMILGRLFQHLFEAGVVVVSTSNRPPQDLYKDGLNRDRFLPFIAMIEECMDVLHVDGGLDYRLGVLKGAPTYHTPLGADSERRLDQAFRQLIGDATPESVDLLIQGRTLRIPTAARGVARASFAELCERALGPADYIALATRFRALVLSGIPRLGWERRNEAKRFVTLIDELYEHKVNLVCSAAVPPHEIYADGDGSFEFARTASRLVEMQSDAFLAEPHRGD
ncbi:MAG: cell division protein ZapE [Alphaproteobacteria bacterium]|nr:cell division protein ZapE [Alphaproteobacteria bacterium]